MEKEAKGNETIRTAYLGSVILHQDVQAVLLTLIDKSRNFFNRGFQFIEMKKAIQN